MIVNLAPIKELMKDLCDRIEDCQYCSGNGSIDGFNACPICGGTGKHLNATALVQEIEETHELLKEAKNQPNHSQG